MKLRYAGRDMDLNIEDRLKKPVRGGVVGTATTKVPIPMPVPRVQDRCNEGIGHKAGSNPAPSPYYPYKNKLEKAFAQQLDAEWRAGVIKGWLYEPFTFKLAEGKRYRVDFITWGEEGTVCYEVKGWHANIRDSLTHLSWAAQRFPFFKWRKAKRSRVGTFDIHDIIV